MDAKFSDLITYFETLATQHVKINHNPEQKHFFRMELDEVLGGINRNDVNYPMFILEGYHFDFTDANADNLLKNRQGAFILLDHLNDSDDFDRIHEIWDELEETGTDILVRMKNDKRNADVPVIRGFQFDSVEVQLVMNEIGNDVGLRFLYTIASSVNTDMDETKWNNNAGSQ